MLSALVDFVLTYPVGTSFVGDLAYSVLSYLHTGVVLEDSLFWTGS